MKRIAVGLCAALIALVPASAEQAPFASPSPGTAQTPGSDTENLGSIMSLVQIRHIKLWYAGQSGNWRLAGFHLQKIRENLSFAAMLYRNVPVEEVEAPGQALTRLLQAVNDRNEAEFTKAFNQLTAGCNSCHAAGGVDFIRIQTPTSSPFSDEVFHPTTR